MLQLDRYDWGFTDVTREQAQDMVQNHLTDGNDLGPVTPIREPNIDENDDTDEAA